MLAAKQKLLCVSLVVLCFFTLIGSTAGAQTFTASGTMITPRYGHTGTMLPGGQVLLAGGTDVSGNVLASAELYSPSTGTFASTGNLNTGRYWNTATLLANGLVLVAGGVDGNGDILSSAELYSPSTGSFTVTGSLNTARFAHTATLLENGTVLFVGGADANGDVFASAELYDPSTGTFTVTGSLNVGREFQTATLLANGSVLVAGGLDSSFAAESSAELFDPVAQTFSLTGSLTTGRFTDTATRLNDGTVLLAGGYDTNDDTLASAELFNPGSGSFSLVGSLVSGRGSPTATLLNNGQVLIVGGVDQATIVADAELYDPVAASFSSTGSPVDARYLQTATLLPNGTTLQAGGADAGENPFAAAETYQASTLDPSGLVSISVIPSNPLLLVNTTESFTAQGVFSNGSVEPLESVSWSSSSNTVGTIGSDLTNDGVGSGLSVGTATVNACAGAICGTATLIVTPPLSSISVSPGSPSLVAGSSQQFTATGIYTDSSEHDLTSLVTWQSSAPSIAAISNANQTQGFGVAVAAGTATLTATLGAVSGTASLTVTTPITIITPAISGASPASGTVGTSVTVTGSGFGSSQGSGYIWIGTAPGVVTSWSDTQIVANVAAGSSTGIVEVQQSGQQSNTVSFTMSTPVISGISPSSGVVGTSVTLSGSGFGASQGSGEVQIGTAAGIVTSWSDTQVIATVSPGAGSGVAQVLQNGNWSNTESFAVTTPQVSGVSPDPASASASVTISGSGFGSSQGSGVVWLGSAAGSVTSWSDTQVVATIASGAASGIARVQQNGTWSNSVGLTITPSGGSVALTLTPDAITMAVGDTHAIEASNPAGQSVTGLTWASSDSTIVSLSTDDPPILTAVATGHVTISAGNASADITVLTGPLPVGTIQWSNAGDGSGVNRIVPAVPSTSGADVFAFQNSGSVSALTADGTTLWSASVSGTGLADFLGGMVVWNNQTVEELAPGTGQANPAYTFTNSPINQSLISLGTDGTIYTVDNNSLVAINPTTGALNFSVPLDQGSATWSSECIGGPRGSVTSSSALPYQMIAAGDGNIYLLYSYENSSSISQTRDDCGIASSTSSDVHLRLLQSAPDGSSSTKIDLGDWSVHASTGIGENDGTHEQIVTSQSGVLPSFNASMLTNSNTGVLVSWAAASDSYCAYSSQWAPSPPAGISNVTTGCAPASSSYFLTTTSGGSVTSNVQVEIPGQAEVLYPVLERQDNTFVGTVEIGPGPGEISQENMVAFNASGEGLWSLPNFQPETSQFDNDISATIDQTSTTTFDTSGEADAQSGPLLISSWSGDSYQLVGGLVQEVTGPAPILTSPDYSNTAGGNPSQTGPGICHDARDSLVGEYVTTTVGDSSYPRPFPRFLPTCFEFTNSAHSQYFTFSEINTPSPNTSPQYGFALVRMPLVVPQSNGYGLDLWRAIYGDSRIINSGYRDPGQNKNSNSRHMLGDATDLGNESGTTDEWERMVDAAGGTVISSTEVDLTHTGANADYIEPQTLPTGQSACGLNCVHADWRYHGRGNYAH